MKLIIKCLFIILLLIAFDASAQTLGQDAEGNSTIITPATSLNLDISNSVGSFLFNREFKIERTPPAGTKDVLRENEKKEDQKKEDQKKEDQKKEDQNKYIKSLYERKSWLVGLEVKGELTNGISNLFTQDKVAAGASFGGVLGRRIQWTGKAKDAQKNYGPIAAQDYSLRKKITKNQELSDKYIVKVAAAIGIPLESFKPASTKDDEYEQFYKARIEMIKKYRKKAKDNGNSPLERKNDTLASLKKIDSILLSGFNKANVAGVQPQSYWDNFYENEYLSANEAIIKSRLDIKLEKSFDKTIWETAHKKVAAKIQILEAEVTYMGIDLKEEKNPVDIDSLLNVYEQLEKDYHTLASKKENYLDKEFHKAFYPVSALFYLRANSKNWSYTYDLANDSTKVEDRFAERNFNGYTIETGVTFNFKRLHYLGFSASYNYASNLAGLTPATFKLQKQDPTITEGQFTEVAEVKALTGVFDSFIRYDINCDYVYLLPLKESPNVAGSPLSNLYISINPYIRHRIYDNSNLLKNNTVLGLGLHAYSSKDNKIMGGIFVQTNDAFGVHAKEESTFGKRIVFGLIAKYNITGLKLAQ